MLNLSFLCTRPLEDCFFSLCSLAILFEVGCSYPDAVLEYHPCCMQKGGKRILSDKMVIYLTCYNYCEEDVVVSDDG